MSYVFRDIKSQVIASQDLRLDILTTAPFGATSQVGLVIHFINAPIRLTVILMAKT